MKALAGAVLAIALILPGCQRTEQAAQPPEQPTEGGGGGTGTMVPQINPSPVQGVPNARLVHGPTGGVKSYGGPPMGAMDPSGIGPGNVDPSAQGGGGGGGAAGEPPLGSPDRYPPPQTLQQEDPNAAPINGAPMKSD